MTWNRLCERYRWAEWLDNYVNPRQYCGYCGMPYWTLRPWSSWRCNHPNCQEDWGQRHWRNPSWK